MARPEKVEEVTKVADRLKRSQSVVLADFCGLTVEQMTGLRVKLRAEQVELKVIKNRLGKRALADAQCDALDECLKGNTIWAFGLKDAAAPAKIMIEFAKENEKLVLKGGLLEGRKLDAAGVKALASMPSRKELLAMMARDLKAPAAKVATVMQAGLLKVAHAFNALGKKLEGAGGGQVAS
ncbi:50S ribosomal protein L10 [Candidatus Sumerlaeota bacterium]|nr:50S ribosomal protein L10 [Candidatus Sumerlaeota bacterium]